MPRDDFYEDFEDAWQNENWRRARLLVRELRKDISPEEVTPLAIPAIIGGVAVRIHTIDPLTLPAGRFYPFEAPSGDHILSYRVLDSENQDITGGLEVRIAQNIISLQSNTPLSHLLLFMVVEAA